MRLEMARVWGDQKTCRAACLALATGVVLTLGSWSDVRAGGSFGANTSCQYDPNGGITAHLTATGSVIFVVQGSCGGVPLSGELEYDPNTHSFAERFYYESKAEVDAIGQCPADPWSTPGVPCTNQSVLIRGDAGVLNVLNNQAKNAPFSLRVINSTGPFQAAFANAARPDPPGMPVAVQARLIPHLSGAQFQTDVDMQWLPPDESGDRPYVQFLVEARPSATDQYPWRTLAIVPRSGRSTYEARVALPPPIPGYGGWVVHACSATALAKTCSDALTPTPAINLSIRNRANLSPFLPPPTPMDARFAALGTRITASWQLAKGASPSLVDQFDIEESAIATPTQWYPRSVVPSAPTTTYVAHVDRAALFVSWMRVCAQHNTFRSCSPAVRVVGGMSIRNQAATGGAFRAQARPSIGAVRPSAPQPSRIWSAPTGSPPSQ